MGRKPTQTFKISLSSVKHQSKTAIFLSELIESIVYVYRATQDPVVFQMGVDIMESIERIARTECGFATVS